MKTVYQRRVRQWGPTVLLAGAVLALIGGATWRQRARARQAGADYMLFRALDVPGRDDIKRPDVQEALARGADPNARMPILDPPLTAWQSVRAWLGRARHPKSAPATRITALTCAGFNHQTGSLKALLDAGAKVDGRSDDLSLYPIDSVSSVSPAFTSDRMCPLELLQDKGPDRLLPPRRSGPHGVTALMVVAGLGLTAADARLLLDRGADVNTRDEDGDTALMNAVASYDQLVLSDGRDSVSYTSMIRLLLGRGANVNAQDRWGRTALMLAAEAQQPDATQILLARGTDATLKDVDGRTAYARAVSAGLTDQLRVLRQHGVTH